jgi:hypothetical protein
MPSRGRGHGGGPSGDGSGQSKRKSAGGNSSPSAGKGKKKPQKVAGGDGAASWGNSSNTSGKILHLFWVVILNVDFDPQFTLTMDNPRSCQPPVATIVMHYLL